jgi:hypothetical protein
VEEASSTLVAGVKRGSLLFSGIVSVGGNADDDMEGVTAGVIPVDEMDVE